MDPDHAVHKEKKLLSPEFSLSVREAVWCYYFEVLVAKIFHLIKPIPYERDRIRYVTIDCPAVLMTEFFIPLIQEAGGVLKRKNSGNREANWKKTKRPTFLLQTEAAMINFFSKGAPLEEVTNLFALKHRNDETTQLVISERFPMEVIFWLKGQQIRCNFFYQIFNKNGQPMVLYLL
jgi:hypothetical protein